MRRSDILAHRGWWEEVAEKNSATAFRRAFEAGFGVETDLRDHCGEVVISHDPPVNGAMTFEAFLNEFGRIATLALNIKSDGLQRAVVDTIRRYSVDLQRSYVFDMSVPDGVGYLFAGMPLFSRVSEYEPQPALLERAVGIWIDSFTGAFPQAAAAESWLSEGYRVAVVSPELHGRPHLGLWTDLRQRGLHEIEGFSICTDFPGSAREFFGAVS